MVRRLVYVAWLNLSWLDFLFSSRSSPHMPSSSKVLEGVFPVCQAFHLHQLTLVAIPESTPCCIFHCSSSGRGIPVTLGYPFLLSPRVTVLLLHKDSVS